MKDVTFRKVDYLGGSTAHKPYESGNLHVEKKGLRAFHLRSWTIPWSEIASIDVAGPDTAESRVTATRVLLIGIFALAAQKKSKLAVVTVRTNAGEEVRFVIHSATSVEVENALWPLRQRYQTSV
jgi:hypothetical protein